jgi:hypothetical protein
MVDFKAFGLQGLDQGIGNGGFVFDEQDVHGGMVEESR